jgi:hypothetical protein
MKSPHQSVKKKYFLSCTSVQLSIARPGPQIRERERRDIENFSALSAGAYTTIWLVRVT